MLDYFGSACKQETHGISCDCQMSDPQSQCRIKSCENGESCQGRDIDAPAFECLISDIPVHIGKPVPKLRFNLEAALNFSDPREIPAYSVPTAAHYLQMPVATLRSWVLGRSYKTQDGAKRFRPIVDLHNKNVPLLSFYNLCEAHVLSVLRKHHQIDLGHIRKAIGFVRKEFGWERPLIQQDFRISGAQLFVEHLGKYVDAAGGGQILLDGIEIYFQRFEWKDNLTSRLYPFTHQRAQESPKLVFIDPNFAFGRPALASMHIATAVIAERYKAGDSIDTLKKDYGCTRLEIEEGLRCELQIKVAA
ncbi:DUF433 domain-containing protein [Rubripirellula obstinata]|uniref:DUF433 domain-containing protein n=1 Tax=Rubripirellula obstinata TaxID=406547 RepID=UPI00138FB5B5|nr:DUF433 domain-containing protein [Rubripirellula obstinata]